MSRYILLSVWMVFATALTMALWCDNRCHELRKHNCVCTSCCRQR